MEIIVRSYNASNRPHFKFVVNYRESGKRKRKFFKAKQPANAWAAFKKAELRKYGVEGTEFSSRLREMARECAEILSAHGKTIADATNFFVAHLKASERSITAAKLVEELLAAKKADGASVRHLGDLKSRLGIFADEFDGQMVATIMTKEIDDWLRSLRVSPVTRNHYRTLLVLAFNFAVQGGYATSNPAERTAKAKVVDSPPGILTVQQTARLIEAASPDILPFIAIGAFAGLRRAEIERLDWSEIDFDDGLIKVTAEKSKTAQKRFVTMQPNLREWLLPLRKLRGNVASQDHFQFRQLFEQARKDAGIKEWPDNALRHSFASYHLAHFKNAASTAMEMGHINSRITYAHYRELVKPKEAERYWNIRPATTEKVVQLVGHH